jgi:hypothetical protein
MNALKSAAWWSAAGVRAVRTAGQTFVASTAAALTLQDVPWQAVAGTVGLATLLSLATSLGGLPEVDQAPQD